MEIPHILEELAYDMGDLPREAIEAAIAKREYITPYLLDILKDASLRIEEIIEYDNYQAHLYAMYLLAQFRETKAFPLMLKLICHGGEIPHAILGDVLTEDLGRILASVCGGKTDTLKQLVENRTLNEYVRAAALESFVKLVGAGLLSRSEAIDYFHELFNGQLEKSKSILWNSLVSCACSLYPEELYSEIQQTFESNLIDCHYISISDVCQILAQEKEKYLYEFYQNAELIEDTLSEMEKWLSVN